MTGSTLAPVPILRTLVVCVVLAFALASCSSDADSDVDDTDDIEVADTGDEAETVETAAADERVEATAAVFADFGPDSPGCAVGVAYPGGRHTAAYGSSDIEAGEPLEPGSIFDIGSVSKQFTAGAIALAVLDGDVALDDNVFDIIDGLAPSYDGVVTIDDLVHHTSGLPDYTELLDADDDEVTTMQDALDVMRANDFVPAFEPGTAFDYSNTNYVLMAEVIQQVTGQSLVEYSAERIFEPLAMNDSVVRDDQGDLLDGQAQGYIDDGEWVRAGSSWQQTGDGAIHSTVGDVLNWAELFFGNSPASDGEVGSADWLLLMLQPGSADDDGSPYAFGISLDEDGDLLTHAGAWTGYSASLTVRPNDELAVAVLCNIDDLDADELASNVMDVWR